MRHCSRSVRRPAIAVCSHQSFAHLSNLTQAGLLGFGLCCRHPRSCAVLCLPTNTFFFAEDYSSLSPSFLLFNPSTSIPGDSNPNALGTTLERLATIEDLCERIYQLMDVSSAEKFRCSVAEHLVGGSILSGSDVQGSNREHRARIPCNTPSEAEVRSRTTSAHLPRSDWCKRSWPLARSRVEYSERHCESTAAFASR